MSGWAWLFFCFCSRYHGYLLVLLVKGRMLTICSLHADSVRIETMEWMELYLIHDKHKSITFKRNAARQLHCIGLHFTLGER